MKDGKIKPQYSGKRSEKIWDIINSFKGSKQERLYASFCLLQNMESTCLTWLNNELNKKGGRSNGQDKRSG